MEAGNFTVERIAVFALRTDHEGLSDEVRDRLKRSVLDGIGGAIGALGAEPVVAVRAVVDAFEGRPLCTLIGGGRTAPDRAALYNGCLVRYLDFMDNVARPGEVCHPIDNFAALLAAAEYADCSGRDLLTALAVSYQVQARLLELPTMRAGLNYTTPLAFSAAAGASRLLNLDETRTAHALALAGVGSVSLACIQAEPVSQWKGLSSGEAASRALHNVFLASHGITGPLGVFDGPLGLFDLVGETLPVDWLQEPLDASLRTSIKRYNAEFQSQSAVDLAITLRQRHALDQIGPDGFRQVRITVADGAYQVLGGGRYGPKTTCHIKEQADHNLLYLVAVALLDGAVGPEQLTGERINRADVQALLKKVLVAPSEAFTKRIPEQMPVTVAIDLDDGRTVSGEASDYEGFHTRPMGWDQVTAKFDRLTAGRLPGALKQDLVAAIQTLETIAVRDLTALLVQVGPKLTG